MSCYTRHLEWLLKEVGAEDVPYSRKRLDKVIREKYEMESDDCELIWRKLKSILSDDSLKQKFTEQIKAAW